MVIQWCLKGIQARAPGFGDKEAADLMQSGIASNWLRANAGLPILSALESAQRSLSESALVAHVNSYAVVRTSTPYISLSAGVVLRDSKLGSRLFPAWRSAVNFATERGKTDGYIFRVWTVVTPQPSPEVIGVSEEIRNLNLFRTSWRWQHQGEITAKVILPSVQIEYFQKITATGSLIGTKQTNPHFVDPATVSNLLREI